MAHLASRSALHSSAMKPTEFFQWWITDERTGKRRKTTYRLKREDAERQFPGCEPDLLSQEVRMLPESPDEWNVARKPG